MKTLKIGHMESVINVWRTRKPAESGVLCREASVLADVYGHMIHFKMEEIPTSSLTEEQQQALQLQ